MQQHQQQQQERAKRSEFDVNRDLRASVRAARQPAPDRAAQQQERDAILARLLS